MNQAPPKKPTELTIDVEQWRRDIQTFVNTTKRALDAIAAELSNGCAKTFVERETIHSTHTSNVEPDAANTIASSTGNRDYSGEDRLETLKKQLAQRISKSI